MALEEALLAENGILDANVGAGQMGNSDATPNGFQEATASNLDQYYYQNQAGSSELNFLSIRLILMSLLVSFLFVCLFFRILARPCNCLSWLFFG